MNKPMDKHWLPAALAIALIGVFVAPRAEAQLTSGPRRVNYQLSEYTYQPKGTLKVRKGETITFSFTNKGKLVHEAVVGTIASQIAHEKEMAAMGGMAIADEADRVALKPGQTKRLTMKFDKPGNYEIACHQTGHYKLGMKIAVVVK